MVQKKTTKKVVNKQISVDKEPTAVQVKKDNPVPVKTTSVVRKENYPIISFILAVLVLIIYFVLGKVFMEMAVQENFCSIRQSDVKTPSGAVVAVIDGEPVYMSEIEDYANSIPQLADLPMEMVYPKLLEDVVNARVLKKAAEKTQIADKPAVQRALKMAYNQIIAQAYMEQALKQRMTDERLNALYEVEKQNFKPTEEVHARHILLKSESEARDMQIRLRAGADFNSMVDKYSQDKSSSNGDLGYFTENMMIPEFGKVVFKMKVGQVSDPIKTPFGWHIVVVDDKRLSEMPSFDEVKPELQKALMVQDVEQVLADERQKLNVTIKKPTL